MRYQKWLFCLLIFCISCVLEQENSFPENENRTTVQSLSVPDPAEAFDCGSIIIQKNPGYGCLVENFIFRLRHSTGKLTKCPCFPFDVKIIHANIDVKLFTKNQPSVLQEAEKWIEEQVKKIKYHGIKSVINLHLAYYKSITDKYCFVLWITSGYVKKTEDNPGGTLWCKNLCYPTPEELKKEVKKAWKGFVAFMGIQGIVGIGFVVGPVGAPVVEWLIIKAHDLLSKYFTTLVFVPAKEESDEDFDDDFDEPDEPGQPLIDDGPPPLSGCECNISTNDGNICFDDTFFGKPVPAEYKPELTVIGRDGNFLYVFGKDAQLYDRAIFWSDPNAEGLENCESWGQWDGVFMVHKLQPCRTWFSITNDSKTIWLSPDSQTTRVVEGVSVVPHGNGYNFALTCGAEQNNFNLLESKDYKNRECAYLSLDEALYSNKGVCFDDSTPGKSLPSNIKPELTVIARRENYIHIFGKDAEIYHTGTFWADPNADLPVWEINGEYNGFSTVFKLPPCRPWLAFSNDEKTIWLSPNTATTRVEDGVSVVYDGQNYNFVLTCGAEPNNFNLLTENDFIQKQPEENQDKKESETPISECKPSDHLVISTQINQIKLEGIGQKVYTLRISGLGQTY